MERLIDSKQIKHEHEHQSIFEIGNLSFGYTPKKLNLVDINLSIHRNEWTTILGPNGSGKSTLVKLLVRLLKPNQGQIKLASSDINSFKPKQYAQKVAYIPQINDIPEGITIYDFVAFGRNPWLKFLNRLSEQDHEIITSALKRVKIYEARAKMMEQISGGERQKVFIALAIAQTSEIVVLDEPTTFLDIKAQYELLELLGNLHREGKTIITILHDINQAVQYSDEIIMLKDGKIVGQGKPETMINAKMLQDVYGIDGKLVEFDGKRYLTGVKIFNKE